MNRFVDSNNNKQACFVVLRELGILLTKNREDFKEVLESSGVLVPANASDSSLVDLFIENAPSNKKLLISASFFINHKNQSSNADGEEEVSDEGVKVTYQVLSDYFIEPENVADTGEEFYNAAAADPVSAIAMALGEGAKLGGKITESKMKKKYGVTDTAAKLREGKSQMLQAIIEKKKADEESKAKTNRTLIIGGVAVVILVLGVFAYTMMRNRNK